MFISYQLFVWLVLVHAAGTRLAFLIDKRKFYWPKWTFLAVLWDVQFAERGFLAVKRAQDPSYWTEMYRNHNFVVLRLVSGFVLCLYCIYFITLTLQVARKIQGSHGTMIRVTMAVAAT